MNGFKNMRTIDQVASARGLEISDIVKNDK